MVAAHDIYSQDTEFKRAKKKNPFGLLVPALH